jgi:EAL domain-containing protein (putative c-di-GMP-specific phosphodiesterase class I)
MIEALTVQFRRLFGVTDQTETSGASEADLPGAAAVPPRAFCVVVHPQDADRSGIRRTLDRAGVRFDEAADAGALDPMIRRRAPDLLVYGFETAADVEAGLEVLTRTGFAGLVQPILTDASGPAGAALHRAGGRFLPSLPSPLPAGALGRVVEEQGLARHPSGHVAVSLQVAFDNSWLEFWYQPKIDLGRRILVGAQLLARVRHPVHGVLEPAAFIGHATTEDLRLLARASVRTALRDWPVFMRAGFNLVCAVTMPVSVLDAAELGALIRLERPSSPRWPGLHLEVAVLDALQNASRLGDFAAATRATNAHLSLAGFGNDVASRSALDAAPWAEIKLRPDMVRCALDDDQRSALCLAAIERARGTFARIVATGLESSGDLAFATVVGCEIGQGRVLAPPQDRAQFLRLLERRRHRRPVDARPRDIPPRETRETGAARGAGTTTTVHAVSGGPGSAGPVRR